MADERDAWLDKDAAERLLRGEPVEVADERVRARTERLGYALRDIAAVTYENQAELPGEEAALAAFRRARVARRGVDGASGSVYEGAYASERDGSHATMHTYGTYESGGARITGTGTGAWNPLGTVRITPLASPEGPGRSGRPARRGLVTAVAGCALGGIAIVVGAGLLPALLGGGPHPVPADSVSTATSPAPLASRSSGVGEDRGDPDGPNVPDVAGTERPPPSRTPSEPQGKGGRTDKGGAEAGRSDDRDPGGGSSDEGTGPGGKHKNWSGPGPARQDGEWYRNTAKACRDYRTGAIDAKRKDALESAAGSSQGTGRFCDRLLGTDLRDGLRNGQGNKGRGNGAGPSLPYQPYLPHQPHQPSEPHQPSDPHQPSEPHQPSAPHEPSEPTPSPTPPPTTSGPTSDPGRGPLTPPPSPTLTTPPHPVTPPATAPGADESPFNPS